MMNQDEFYNSLIISKLPPPIFYGSGNCFVIVWVGGCELGHTNLGKSEKPTNIHIYFYVLQQNV